MRPAASRRGTPRAPWGAFPLAELTVLLALGLGAFGLANLGTARGTWGVGAATTLGCLAGLEIAIREHFSGHRRRTMLLAGTVAAIASVGAVLVRLPPPATLAAAGAAGLAAVPLLERAFTRARAGRPPRES